MRTRSLFATIGAALVLAVPATASADPLTSFHDAIEGSQQPIPGGRGEVSFGSDENPCRYYSFDANRQDGYVGLTDNAETWRQIGRPPTLLPPGTFWEKGEEEGYFPTEKSAVEAIPAGDRHHAETPRSNCKRSAPEANEALRRGGQMRFGRTRGAQLKPA